MVYVDGQLRYEKKGDEYEIIYRYNNDGTLASVTRNRFSDGQTDILYAVTNTRGDVIELRSGSGAVNTVYTYDSWGKLISATNASGTALASTNLGVQNSIRYRGYVYDTETGLYYLQSRYYDPETGRFLNADDVDFIGASGTVLGYNAFAYCENNAINCADDFGQGKTYCVMSSGLTVDSFTNLLNILNKARILFEGCGLFKISYMQKISYYNGKHISYKEPDYVLRQRILNYGDIQLIYHGSGSLPNAINKKVIGRLGIRTVKDWYKFIAEKHKTILTRVEEAALSKLGIKEETYDDFINALGQTTGPDFIGTILFYRDLIKLLEGRMDAEDRYINSIVKKYKSNKTIMIVLKAEYYHYATKSVMILGGYQRWYKTWVLASIKYPY